MNTPLIFINNDEEYSGFCQSNKKCCVAYDYNFIIGQEIKGQALEPNKFQGDKNNKNAIFFDNCRKFRITICNFKNCYTNDDFGGGLLVKQNFQVIPHQTIFDTCHSKKHGAAGAIAQDLIVEEYVYNNDENDKRPQDPNHTCTIKIDIQYSCFQNCYTETDVSLFYASTVDCPGQEKKTWGAQFDIMAKIQLVLNLLMQLAKTRIFVAQLNMEMLIMGSLGFKRSLKCIVNMQLRSHL
ncbi:hypothetical protein M9Y10_016265 [Tritrichomonas musculus]|uniref:Uncharacterized protein n=1 Tax=Tritrichomonas musculus TaxID=1915356 RepID=A0ABR2HWN5_9EUKA